MLTLISSTERFAGILFGGQKVIHFTAFDCQTPSEKLHAFISAPENCICSFFFIKNNLIHIFRNV